LQNLETAHLDRTSYIEGRWGHAKSWPLQQSENMWKTKILLAEQTISLAPCPSILAQLNTCFQQIFAAVWYREGIWRAWCSRKASEIYSLLVWMKILENKHSSAQKRPKQQSTNSWSPSFLRFKKLYHIFFTLHHAQSSSGHNLGTLQIKVFLHFVNP
jgi:hypothetical protein